MIIGMFQNMSQQLDIQRHRNNNLQQQINILTKELIKHKRCIVGIIEANFDVMSTLMQKLKSNDYSEEERDEMQNDTES